MYLVPLKTVIVKALRATFTARYPNGDFQDVYCSIEYPIEQSSYPGIWVQYEDNAELQIAGIDHQEFEFDPSTQTFTQYTRWQFAGTATLTVAALSSMERDRLYDEVVRTFAFGKYNKDLGIFRKTIEENDYLALNFNYDDLRPFGDNAAPGTPWQTDEIIYEKSLSINLIGSFVSDADTNQLVSLSKIIAQGYVQNQEQPPTWIDGPFPADPADPENIIQGPFPANPYIL